VRAAVLDLVLPVLTILVLAGVAAGIAIGFPQALEIVAAQANAAIASSSETHAPERGSQPAEGKEEENEPFFADDIRTAGATYAFAAGAGAERSAPDASDTRHR
jgi:hypothetical protein